METWYDRHKRYYAYYKRDELNNFLSMHGFKPLRTRMVVGLGRHKVIISYSIKIGKFKQQKIGVK